MADDKSKRRSTESARVAAGEKDEVDYLKSILLNETASS
jgi:hypothetical protein